MVNVSVRREIVGKILSTIRDMMIPLELTRYSFEYKRQSIRISITTFICIELPIVYKPNTILPRKFKGLNSLKNFMFANIDINKTINGLDVKIFNAIIESKRRYTNLWWSKNTPTPPTITHFIKTVKFRDRVYNVELMKLVTICSLKRKKS